MKNKWYYLKKMVRLGRASFTAKLLLAVVIGLVVLGPLPAPVQAQEAPIDLVVGGDGVTAWSFLDIKPCATGTETITLHNAGYKDGFVTIWVDITENSEGINPEPEPDTKEPGELLAHMLFNIYTNPPDRLKTNISMPTTLDKLPQSASDPNYIWIVPLNAGETITLYWEWELPCDTGNEAQGDILSFIITYFLEELPPSSEPPSPCPDPYGPQGPGCYFEIDMLTKITRVDVDCCTNKVLGTRVAPDPDGLHFLEIERDTLVICEDCTGCECYPRVVVMSPATEKPPQPNDGRIIIEPVYDFTGYRDIERLEACTPVTFNSPISVVLSYDPEALPEGAHSLVIAFYDDELGQWIELQPDPGRVAEVGRIAALADYFKSPFAILADVSPQQLTFELNNLNIVPSLSEIWEAVTFVKKIGDEVTITADVTNSTGQEGSYTAILKINGEVRDTRELVLGPGQSEQVVFTISDIEPGHYTVVLGSLSGEFTTSLWINWWLIGGIIAALILLGWLVWYRRRLVLHRRRKRKAKPAS